MRWHKFLSLALLIAASVAIPAQASLVNYWTFDSDGTDSVKNESGTFIGAASITNAAGEYMQGTGGLKVAHNTASGDYFDVDYSVLPTQSVYSTSFWFKYDNSISSQVPDSRSFPYETAPSWYSSVELAPSTGQLKFSADAVSGQTDLLGKVVVPGPVNDGWHFYTVTYDAINNESLHYIDGSFSSSYAAPQVDVGNGLHIGSHRSGDGTRNWSGYIDDFAIYEGVIEEADVYNLYSGVYTPETVPVDDSFIPQVPTGQPVAHWSFDSNFSSSVNNDLYAGTPNETTYTTIDTTAGAAVRGSGALRLDSGSTSGTGTFVDVSNSDNLGVLDPQDHKQVAVSVWLKAEDLSADGSDARMAVYETAPAYALSLEVATSTTGEMFTKWWALTDAGSSSTPTSLKNYGPEVTPGEWCHVLTNYDLETNRTQYYFNGELLYDQPLAGDSFAAIESLKIGNHRTGDGTRDFDGYIDDMAVYHGVMTPEAVAGLYDGTYTATNVPVVSGLANFTYNATIADENITQVMTGEFPSASGLSRSNDDSLIVVSRHATEGFIAKIAQDGTQTLLVDSADAPNIAATAVNQAGDLFFVSDYGGIVQRVATGTTTVETWASDFNADGLDDDGTSMVIVPATYTGGLVNPGSLLMVDRGSGGFEEIVSISTVLAETYSTLVSDDDMADGVGNILIDPTAIAVTDTQIFVSDFAARKIYEVTAADTLVEFLETDYSSPIFSMIADPSTGDLITLNGIGEIHRIDTATGLEELIITLEERCQTGTAAFNQLAISDNGTQLAVASPDTDMLYLFSLGSAQIAGDANKDGKVDGSDVTILAGNWQAGVGNPDPSTITWEMGDFNGDGQIDGSDVTILAGNWQYGVTAAAAAVPEPSTLVLLIGLVLGVAWCKRR